MKSRLLSKNPWLENEKFKDDLPKLLSINEQTISEFPLVIADVHLADTTADSDEIFLKAAAKLDVDESKLRSAFQVGGAFIVELSPEGDGRNDTVQDIVDDISQAMDLDQVQINRLSRFLYSAKKIAEEKFYQSQKKKEYEQSGMPTLVGISGTINLRAIFDKQFKSNIDVADYSPKCEGITPVAILKLRLDPESPQENIFFQMTSREIRMMIDHLSSMEKQIREVISFAKLRESE